MTTPLRLHSMNLRLRLMLALLTLLATVSCSKTEGTPDRSSPTPISRPPATPTQPLDRAGRRARLIPVEKAVARLQKHVDVDIVLPRDRLAGLVRYRKWQADPKYLSWGRTKGVRHGSMKLVKGERILLLDFGLVTFDGCGGTDLSIPTKVGDKPGYVSVSREGLWSHVVWPMRQGDTSATYGLAGTFEGWQIVRLATSMETGGARSRIEQGC